MRRKHWNVKRSKTKSRPRVSRAYNRMKLRALATLEDRGWLSAAAWAVLAGYYPVRASYTYLKRLWRWKLLERQLDKRGLLLYRMSNRGQVRLVLLRKHVR